MPPSSALLPRAHGIAASPDELQAALIDALARYRSVLYPASASALPTAEAGLLRAKLGKRYGDLRRLRAGHWYEWNLRDRQALEALASIEIR